MISRRTPLKGARKPMKRGGRIKPKKRSASEYARIYGSKERVAFVKARRCLVWYCLEGPCENHHIENGGAGRKADYTKIVPLCHLHHQQFHQIGRDSFQNTYAIPLNAAAVEVEAAWQSLRRAWLEHTPTQD